MKQLIYKRSMSAPLIDDHPFFNTRFAISTTNFHPSQSSDARYGKMNEGRGQYIKLTKMILIARPNSPPPTCLVVPEVVPYEAAAKKEEEDMKQEA